MGARGAASTARTCCRELLAEHGDALADEVGLPRRLLDELGAVPSYYLHYFYAHDRVLAEQLRRACRAPRRSRRSSASCSSCTATRALNEKPALLEQRGGAFYSEAAIGLVALAGRRGDGGVHVVDVRNDGTLAGLADDDVVEVPARVGARRRRAAAAAAARPGAARARCSTSPPTSGSPRRPRSSGDRGVARKALLAHPLIGQDAVAEELVERLLEAGRSTCRVPR